MGSRAGGFGVAIRPGMSPLHPGSNAWATALQLHHLSIIRRLGFMFEHLPWHDPIASRGT
jgi:hypothetical protein